MKLRLFGAREDIILFIKETIGVLNAINIRCTKGVSNSASHKKKLQPKPNMPHEQTEHEFANPELSYDGEPNFQPCLRVSVFFNKNEKIDYDTFYGHWQTVHADLAVSTKAFGDGIFRYTQVRVIAINPMIPVLNMSPEPSHSRDERGSQKVG